MIVGCIRLAFQIPEGQSEKSAAHVVKDHIWSKYKAAVAQVSVGDSSLLTIGVAIVGEDLPQVQKRVDSIIREISEWGKLVLINHESESIHYDDLEIERDFEKYNP